MCPSLVVSGSGITKNEYTELMQTAVDRATSIVEQHASVQRELEVSIADGGVDTGTRGNKTIRPDPTPGPTTAAADSDLDTSDEDNSDSDVEVVDLSDPSALAKAYRTSSLATKKRATANAAKDYPADAPARGSKGVMSMKKGRHSRLANDAAGVREMAGLKSSIESFMLSRRDEKATQHATMHLAYAWSTQLNLDNQTLIDGGEEPVCSEDDFDVLMLWMREQPKPFAAALEVLAQRKLPRAVVVKVMVTQGRSCTRGL